MPYDGDNFMRVLSRHLTEPLTLPSTMAPDAASAPVVEAVIVKALSKRPEERYQSMTEFEAAIHRHRARRQPRQPSLRRSAPESGA